MRLLHTSDWHLGRSLEGRSRLREQEQFIEELVAIVAGENVQLILVAGDVFDTYNPLIRRIHTDIGRVNASLSIRGVK